MLSNLSLEVTLEEDGSALVQVSYRLRPADQGAAGSAGRADGSAEAGPDTVFTDPYSITLELLQFGDATVDGVDMGPERPDSGRTLHRLTQGPGSLRSLDVSVGPGWSSAEALAARYTVSGAVTGEPPEVRVRIPVLVPAVPPVEVGYVFRAEVRVPEEWRIFAAFPSGLDDRGRAPPRTLQVKTLQVDTRVPPAVIDFRARTDGSWRAELGFTLTALASLLLVSVGVAAWRLGIVRREPEADEG